MSEEGELYKKLVHLKPQSEVEMMVGQALRVNTSTVQTVLDEAKKEIPQDDSLKEKWFDDRDFEFRQKANAWFEKWFGSVEATK